MQLVLNRLDATVAKQEKLASDLKTISDTINRRAKHREAATESAVAGAFPRPELPQQASTSSLADCSVGPIYSSLNIQTGAIDVGSTTQSYKIQMNKVDYDECYRSSKDGCTLLLKLMDKLFDRAKLMNANLHGGVVMSKEEGTVKQPSCSVKVNAMFSRADLQYPGFPAYIGTKAREKEIRNAING